MSRRFLFLASVFLICSAVAATTSALEEPKPKLDDDELSIKVVSAWMVRQEHHTVRYTQSGKMLLVDAKDDQFGAPILKLTVLSHHGITGVGFRCKAFDQSGRDITEDQKIHKPTDPEFGFYWFAGGTLSAKDEKVFDFPLPKDLKVETVKGSISELCFPGNRSVRLKVHVTFEAKFKPSPRKEIPWLP